MISDDLRIWDTLYYEDNGDGDVDKIEFDLKIPRSKINKMIDSLRESGTIFEPKPGLVAFSAKGKKENP